MLECLSISSSCNAEEVSKFYMETQSYVLTDHVVTDYYFRLPYQNYMNIYTLLTCDGDNMDDKDVQDLFKYAGRPIYIVVILSLMALDFM